MSRRECPISGCHKAMADRQVMCERHWKQVPPPLQRDIRKEKTVRGPAWEEAVAKAIHHVNHELSLDREMERYIQFHRDADLRYPWRS
jgi:hypothetical protein